MEAYSNSDESEETNKRYKETKIGMSTSRSSRQSVSSENKMLMNPRELAEFCTYIPMRLTPSERLQLVVLENALEVCEYTDVVDVSFSHTRKNKYTRILESLIDTLSISCGLIASNNLHKGEELLKKTLNENVPIFRDLFEVGRRFKIMNPNKMRDTYGKLMYLLMDAESNMIKNEIRVNFGKPILTVASFLQEREATTMLQDPNFFTSVSSNDNVTKEAAKRQLMSYYESNSMTKEDIQRVLDSVLDNEAYKMFNVRPVETMLNILEESFDPLKPNDIYSLELNGRNMGKKVLNTLSYGFSGRYFGGGACLSHDHKTQFTFVKQSLQLWREIMFYMPKLWYLADLDMLSEPYRLADTGQGYQRLQCCPRVKSEMNRILSSVQNKTTHWVGLSVIHLGDRDVPNALIL